MDPILIAVMIMTGLGITFATILALADHFLHVEEDPHLEEIELLLPGNNCGACGEPGCHSFAEKLVKGEVSPGLYTVSSQEVLTQIAAAQR
jgi:Na+-translocating ferredoxin:NAD+ oxidoreductase RNF subunit RnfB